MDARNVRTKIAYLLLECDRCPAKYEDRSEEHDPNKEWAKIQRVNEDPIDLCPACKKSFVEWLEAPKNWIKPEKE